MATLDNREKNYEYKLVRKALAGLDARVQTPESLSGAALLHKLDGLPASEKKARGGAVFFDPRWFRWQPVFTYAAAFVLIVALFYGLGLNRADVVEGNMLIAPSSAEPSVAPFAAAAQDSASPEEADEDAPRASSQSSDPAFAASGDGPETDGTPSSDIPETRGVGGAGHAVLLLSQDGYTYSYRQNDKTDPDKKDFPVTLEIIQEAGAQAVAQVDIADMREIMDCFVSQNRLVLVGRYDNSIVARSYDIETPTAPAELTLLTQPGEYLGARLYGDTVHILSLAPGEDAASYEAQPLPGSLSEDVCIVSGLSLPDGSAVQKAFSGATADVKLLSLNVYIYYDGKGEDDQLPELHCAQIRIDGLNIDLTGVS